MADAEQNDVMKRYEALLKSAADSDREVVDANVKATLIELSGRRISSEMADKAILKVVADQIPTLEQMATHRKDNGLTSTVDYFAPAGGKGSTRIDAGMSFQPSASETVTGYNLNINQGFNAEDLGFTRASLHANANISPEGKVGGAIGARGVTALPEALQPEGATLFVAGDVTGTVSPKGQLGGSATVLAVAATNVLDNPVGVYAGAAVDLKTGDITKVAQVEAMFNAETNHPLTVGVGAATTNFTAETTVANVSAFQQYKDFYLGAVASVPVNQPENTAINLQAGMRF
jgi:hypothetical protein